MHSEVTDLIRLTFFAGMPEEWSYSLTRKDWQYFHDQIGADDKAGWSKQEKRIIKATIRAALEKPCTCTLGDGPAGVCGICGGVRA